MSSPISNATIAIIGGGPAGLMAAEVLAAAGHAVTVFDAKPSVGRKFLLAGKGGLNLTHSEPFEPFVGRFGERAVQLAPLLRGFDGDALRDWAAGLGIETFVGTSGRVFPKDLKAAPLLRAWLQRLRAAGVKFAMRHRWTGWAEDGALRFDTPDGERLVTPQATLLALGGASWPQLGSDGAWAPWLAARGVDIAPLQPANCGFDVGPTAAHADGPGWSHRFAAEFAGQPIKPVALATDGFANRAGEFVITATGIEGSLVLPDSGFVEIAGQDVAAQHPRVLFHVDARQLVGDPVGGQRGDPLAMRQGQGFEPLTQGNVQRQVGRQLEFALDPGGDRLHRLRPRPLLQRPGSLRRKAAAQRQGGEPFRPFLHHSRSL